MNNIINIKGGEKNEKTNTINNNSNNNGDSAIKFSNIKVDVMGGRIQL